MKHDVINIEGKKTTNVELSEASYFNLILSDLKVGLKNFDSKSMAAL